MNIRDFVNEEKLVYLAGPYSHPDKHVQQIREVLHNDYTFLIYDVYKQPVFGPITQSAVLAENYNLSGAYDYWKQMDRMMVRKCDAVWVIAIPGWKESIGVTDELNLARKLKKEILFIEEKEGEIIINKKLSRQYGTLKRKKERA